MKKKQNQTRCKSLLFTLAILLLIGVVTKTGTVSADAASKAKRTAKIGYNTVNQTLYITEKGVTLCTSPYKKEAVYAKKDIAYGRKGPGYTFKKTKSLKKDAGEKLIRIGLVENNRWAIVRSESGSYVFVPNRYLTTEKPKAYMPSRLYKSHHLRYRGVIHWNGWRWTWYSQRRMPGHGLHIPGRHVDKHGYVCDKDGFICLASSRLGKGSVVRTPFGKKGKVYDSGCSRNTLDVYTNF